MTSLFRIFKSNFNPPPTVESVGLRPEPTSSGVDTQVLDQQLRQLSKAGVERLAREPSASVR